MKFLVVAAVSLGVASTAGADSLQVTVTTSPTANPQYAPNNIVAVWVQAPGGAFVKTIGRWAAQRKQYLLGWIAAAGANDADAITGATRASHAAPLTLTWNVLDRLGQPLPDGTYTIRMEATDRNAGAQAQNNQGTFTFVKGPAAQTQTALTNGGFSNVSITYTPAAPVSGCNNGALDAGESCDPALAGSCPATCAASADACMPNVLVGTAATCSAECEVQPITACVDGDGCCAEGCAEDTDCAGDGESSQVAGGCAVGGDASLLAFALPGLALALRRRRRP